MSVGCALEQLVSLLIILIYLAKNYPELIPWVIGLVVSINVIGIGVNKLVKVASGDKAKKSGRK